MPVPHVHLLGIPELDEDHMALALLITELEIAQKHRASATAVALIIARLIKSASAHFAREERMMEADRYPFVQPHREKHTGLIAFIKILGEHLSTGKVRLDEETIASLWEWELAHIDTSDREYAEFVHNRTSADI